MLREVKGEVGSRERGRGDTWETIPEKQRELDVCLCNNILLEQHIFFPVMQIGQIESERRNIVMCRV